MLECDKKLSLWEIFSRQLKDIMINIFPIDAKTLSCLMSRNEMIWILIIIILRSRTIDETFIIIFFLLAFDVSVYLSSSKSLVVEENINHVVFQEWFLMTLKMFYCRQFSLSSLMNKSSSPEDVFVYLMKFPSSRKVNRFVIELIQLSFVNLNLITAMPEKDLNF